MPVARDACSPEAVAADRESIRMLLACCHRLSFVAPSDMLRHAAACRSMIMSQHVAAQWSQHVKPQHAAGASLAHSGD